IVAEGNQVKYYLKSPTDSAFVLKYTSTKTYDSAAEYFVDSSLIDQEAKIEGAVLGHNLGMSATTLRTSQSVYDARGELVYSLDAAGYVTHQEYDAQGHVIRTTRYAEAVSGIGIAPTEGAMDAAVANIADSSRDQVTQFVYDDLGRLRFSLNAEGYVSETVYNGFNQVVEERQYAEVYTGTATHAELSTLAIDNATRITRYQYDARGQVIRQSQRLMAGSSETWISESYTYDHAGNRTSVMDARGNTTSFAYDDNNRLIAKLAPRDSVDDSQVAAADRQGYVIRYRYDGFDNLLSETHYTTAVSVYEKTAADYVSDGVTLNNDAQGGDRTTRYEYDALNRQVRIYAPDVDGETLVTRKDYDRFGNVVQLVSGEGLSNAQTSTYVFDDLNRVILETKAAGSAEASTTGYEYNAFGQITRVIDPRYYELTTNLTDWTKEELGRLQTLALNYESDQNGLWATHQAVWLSKYTSTLKFLSPDKLPSSSESKILKEIYSHSQDFDRRGLKISETDGEGYTASSDYDAFGNLIQSTDAEGNVGYFFYDELNRLTLQVDPAGYVQGYAYNASGQVVSKTAWNTPISTDLSGKSLAQVQSMVVSDAGNDRHTGSVFDTLGRVVEEQAQKTSSTVVSDQYTYDASGNRLSWTNRENQVTQYQYDAQGRRTATIHPSATVVFNSDISNTAERQLAEQVRYDAFGNKVAVTEGSYWDSSSQSFKTITGQTRTTLFDHDKLNREVAVWSAVTNFDYYNTEGVLKSNSNVRQVTTREFDLFGNRLKETVQAYQIDGNGKPTTEIGSFQKQLFEYDSLNRLKAQVNAAGGVTTYAYDGQGNRYRERQYGEALSPISNGNLATLLVSGTDDYRELTSVYDLNNRVVETRTRAETHFDLAPDVQGLSERAKGASTEGSGSEEQSGGLYSTRYRTAEIRSFQLYDGNGQLIAEKDSRGSIIRYFYDKRGEQIAKLDAGVSHFDKKINSDTGETVIDPETGKEVIEISHHHALTTWKVNGFGQITEEYRYAYEVKNPSTTATLDELKSKIDDVRSLAESKAAGLAGTDLADLDNEDVLDSQVQADRRTVSDYDQLGRKVRDIVYNVEDYSLSGNAPVKTSATSRTTEYTYDNLDRLSTTIAPGDGGRMGRTSELRYDALGRVATELGQQFTDYRGVSVRATTTYSYDAMGRAVATTRHGSVDVEDQTQKVHYDVLGYVQSEEDATGAVIYYRTDIFGNTVEKQWTQTGADNTSTTYTYKYWYDAQNREIKHEDTENLSYETRYNGYGDIEAKGMNGQYQEQYKYDKVGRLFSTNKETGAPQLYLYDQNGNATAEFILVNEALVDDNGNPLDVDLSTIEAPADLQGIPALNSQMKVSIYDERNRLTNTFDAPHDYQQLTANIAESIEDIGWVSDIDYDNWVLTTSDVATMTFVGESGEPVFMGSDDVGTINSGSSSTTENGDEIYLPVVPNTSESYVQQDFESFGLSEVQDVLDLTEGLDAVHASYSEINLTSSTDSYSTAWKRELLEYSGKDNTTGDFLFTKTVVRVWRSQENDKYYIYRDVERQSYSLSSTKIESPDEVKDVTLGTRENDQNTNDDNESIVTITSSKDGAIVVSGGRLVTHDMKRAHVVVKTASAYTKVGNGDGSIRAYGRDNVAIDIRKFVSAMYPGVCTMFYDVNIPSELRNLGVPLKAYLYLGSNRIDEADVPASGPAKLTYFEITPPQVNTRTHTIKIVAPTWGDKVLFSKSYTFDPWRAWIDEYDSISGLTTTGFVVIEELNSGSVAILGSVGGLSLDYAEKWGTNYVLAVPENSYLVKYQTINSSRDVLNSASANVSIGNGTSDSGQYSNEYIETVTQTRQITWSTSGSTSGAGSDELGSDWSLENNQQKVVTQAYTATYVLGAHNSQYMIHRSRRYNSFGEIIAEVDGNGNESHLFYDAQGRLTHKIDPKVEIAQDYADSEGKMIALEAHPVTRYYYDAEGRVVATDDANSYLNAQDESYSVMMGKGAYYRTQIFNGGMLKSEIDAVGVATTYQYDALGNRRTMASADGQYHSYIYDKADRLVETRHFASLSSYVINTRGAAYSYDAYGYDEYGNRITHANVINNVEKYTYDGEGRIIRHTSFGGRDIVYKYKYDYNIGDNLGGFTKETISGLNADSDASYKSNYTLLDEVDYFGRIRKHRDLGGNQFTYKYNQAGWLVSQEGNTSTFYDDELIPGNTGIYSDLRDRSDQRIEYHYYNNGRLQSIYDYGIGSYSDFQYDANGNVIEETYRDTAFTEMDNTDESLEHSIPYQNVHATYDALGRIKTISDTDQYSLEYFYDAVGNRRRVKTDYDNYVISLNEQGENKRTQDFYYLYDRENRFIVTMGSLNESGKIEEGNTGYRLSYDAMGRRATSRSALLNETGEVNTANEKYVYDQYGRLSEVWLEQQKTELLNKSGTGVEYRYDRDSEGDLLTESSPTYMGKNFYLLAYRQNDALGRTTNHYTYDYYADSPSTALQFVRSQKEYLYNADNRTISETSYEQEGYDRISKEIGTLAYTYLNDGATLKSTKYVPKDGGAATITTKYFYDARDRFDSYKESRVVISGEAKGWVPGTSYYAYNANGHNLFVYDHVVDRSLNYINNHRGQIIQREDINGAERGDKNTVRRKFYYLDGIVRGDMGNDDVPSRTDYVQYLANEDDREYVVGATTYTTRWGAGDKPHYRTHTRDIKEKLGYSHMKRVVPVTSADFDQNYQPINPEYPGKASTFYTVVQGETLQSIAASLWGDRSLWYLIADANGLSGGEALTSGLNLVIPNLVTNIHNNADTFRPYDPGLSLGDTAPTLPDPPPPPRNGKNCGGAGLIVMIVAVAVTAIVAPYAAGAIANIASATSAAGIAGTAGLGTLGATTSIAATASGYASLAAGGFAGGFLGSAASQLVAKEAGLQDHFSLRSAIRGGLTTAATMTVGAYTGNAAAAAESGVESAIKDAGKLAGLGKWTRTAANAITAATAVGANYVAGGLTNTPRSFRWRDVATSFLSTTATTGLGKGFTGNALLDGGLKGALNSSFS
ncbi:hypothetical protein BTA51_28545, partial [Hahella sp. CCB-MM4]